MFFVVFITKFIRVTFACHKIILDGETMLKRTTLDKMEFRKFYKRVIAKVYLDCQKFECAKQNG